MTPTTTTSSPVTSTSTTPATTSAPFTAADGNKLKACGDGTCEVFVKTGDSVPNVSGLGPIGITIEDGKISITMGGLSATSELGDAHQFNNQTILPVAVEGDRGVLRLSKT